MPSPELITKVLACLTEELNSEALDHGQPSLEADWTTLTYRGSVQAYNSTVHVFTGDEDPPFDIVAYEAEDGEIYQVSWVADGYWAISEPR